MTRYSRRRFLGTSLTAAASVYAAPRLVRARNANEKMGVAVTSTTEVATEV